MAYTHGVYIQERPTSIIPPITADSAVQFVVGVAPSHQLADPAATLNRPVLVNNYREFVEAFGWSDDFEKYTLCQVASASFQVFNVAPLVCVNVFDPKQGGTQRTGVALQVSGQQTIFPPADKDIVFSSVVVKSQDGNTTYQRGTDYDLEYNEAGALMLYALPAGAMADGPVSATYTLANTATVTENSIIGGYDAATATYTGLELVGQVYPQLGLIPGLILAPGFSQKPAVAAAMMAKTEGINGVFRAHAIADADSTTANTYEKVQAWKNSNGYVDPNLTVCWPKVKVGERTYWLSTLAAALTAYTDAQNGSTPFASPSNKTLRISGTVLADGKAVYLDQTQGNFLNGGGIVTAINQGGWRLWGNNTSVYPSVSDPKDRWIAVRRTFNWWGNTFILTYFQKVDSPANRRLIQSILDSENIRANGYVARGQIAGAKIEFLDDENPITDLLNGKITFLQHLTPYIPAETIVNILEFDPDTLRAALGGE